MSDSAFRFGRMEFAGSLGDLGTLLPLGLGMIVINGLSAHGVFFSIGLFYIFAGLYFRVPTPVQPMKVIGAYAVATAATSSEVTAAGIMVAAVLLLVGVTGFIDQLRRIVPTSVIRGVQFSTGTILTAQGVRLVAGTSVHQAGPGGAEPYLIMQSLGPLPFGIVLGVLFFLLTFLLLDSKKVPAGLAVIVGGLLVGIFLGQNQGLDALSLGLYLPDVLPFGLPSWVDFLVVLPVMVLPQLPMTMGNAVVANADLSHEYFGKQSARVTPSALCLSMGLANAVSALFGGMPVCHGAGGLAAHYRFGARTAGSNLIIGVVFLGGAILLGPQAVALARLLPLSVLGVLLVFAGGQLALTILDVRQRKDMFVVVTMLGVSLGSSLAWGFGAGLLVAFALRSNRFSV